jgi:hypothetical protein
MCLSDRCDGFSLLLAVRIRIHVSLILCILSPSLPSVPVFPPYARPLPHAVSQSLYFLFSFLSYCFSSIYFHSPTYSLPRSSTSFSHPFPSLPILSLYLPHPTPNLPIPPLLSSLTPTPSLSHSIFLSSSLTPTPSLFSSLTPSPSYPPSLPLFLPLLSTSRTPYSLSLRYVGDAPSFPLRFCVTESGCAFELPNDPDYSKTTDGATLTLILLYSALMCFSLLCLVLLYFSKIFSLLSPLICLI